MNRFSERQRHDIRALQDFALSDEFFRLRVQLGVAIPSPALPE